MDGVRSQTPYTQTRSASSSACFQGGEGRAPLKQSDRILIKTLLSEGCYSGAMEMFRKQTEEVFALYGKGAECY